MITSSRTGWAALIQALHETGYDGIFNYEVPRERDRLLSVRLARLDYGLRLKKAMPAQIQ